MLKAHGVHLDCKVQVHKDLVLELKVSHNRVPVLEGRVHGVDHHSRLVGDQADSKALKVSQAKDHLGSKVDHGELQAQLPMALQDQEDLDLVVKAV